MVPLFRRGAVCHWRRPGWARHPNHPTSRFGAVTVETAPASTTSFAQTVTSSLPPPSQPTYSCFELPGSSVILPTSPIYYQEPGTSHLNTQSSKKSRSFHTTRTVLQSARAGPSPAPLLHQRRTLSSLPTFHTRCFVQTCTKSIWTPPGPPTTATPSTAPTTMPTTRLWARETPRPL